jgi:Predicted carbamoyl transferase, NodU family
MNRASNPYYARLKQVLHFGQGGEIRLNRSMANWYADPFDHPYKPSLIEILGEPLRPDQLWNPDAVLRVEDIHHRPDTKDRSRQGGGDATGAGGRHYPRGGSSPARDGRQPAGADRGRGVERARQHAAARAFRRGLVRVVPKRNARLHLWVPPTPSDPGVTIGAAWLFAHLAGAPRGAPLTHAFYCGTPPSHQDIATALEADDIASTRIGDISTADGRDAIADLMAFMVAQNGVIALYQGAAETGPRALGHRSIFANPCDPEARERLNERVKIPRGDPPAGADGDARRRAGVFQAERGRLGRQVTTPITTWC